MRQRAVMGERGAKVPQVDNATAIRAAHEMLHLRGVDRLAGERIL